MTKQRYKVLINWQGEVLEFYRHATSAPQALQLSIRKLSKEVGYDLRYVKKYVMDSDKRRWEIVE